MLERRLTGERAAAFRVALRELWREPLGVTRGLLAQAWQMAAADAFGIERLLHPTAGAYPHLSTAARGRTALALRWSFPLLGALAAAGAVVNPTVRVCLIPGVGAFLAMSVVLARTRFHYALFPALAAERAPGPA